MKKPLTPSEMAKKGRKNLHKKLGSKEAISNYYKEMSKKGLAKRWGKDKVVHN